MTLQPFIPFIRCCTALFYRITLAYISINSNWIVIHYTHYNFSLALADAVNFRVCRREWGQLRHRRWTTRSTVISVQMRVFCILHTPSFKYITICVTHLSFGNLCHLKVCCHMAASVIFMIHTRMYTMYAKREPCCHAEQEKVQPNIPKNSMQFS